MARSSSTNTHYISASVGTTQSLNFSASIWYKPDHNPTTATNSAVCGYTLSGDQRADFGLIWNHTSAAYYRSWAFSCSNSWPKVQYTNALTADGSWYHLGMTYDKVNAYAYLNGAQDGSTATTGAQYLLIEPKAFVLGATVNFINPEGVAYDFAVWNVALTISEMAALAKGVRPYRIRRASLVTYWPLDGLESPEPDLSGAAKNGTVSGPVFAPGPPATMFTPRWPRNIEPAAAAPSFIPVWAAQSNLPVIGAGTY